MMYAVHCKSPGVVLEQKYNFLNTISTNNLVAFTTNRNILDTTSTTASGYHCFVADINCPWYPTKVLTNKYPISVLEWDVTGRYLLIGDTIGSVMIFGQKDNLVSDWIQLYSVEFKGEHIIRAVFFHNGIKMTFNYEKKDSISYSDKYIKSKFQPSVRQFGGVPAEGCLIVSATGMLGAFIIPHEVPNTTNGPQVLIATTESLAKTRNFYTTADITFTKTGHLMVAITNGLRNQASNIVQCFKVAIKKDNGIATGCPLTLTSHALPSFFLCEGQGRDLPDLQVVKLKWTAQEDADSILVATNSSSGAFLELWTLQEKVTLIHKLFQTNKGEVHKSLTWSNQSTYHSNAAKLTDVCVTKVKLCQNTYVYVALQDNTIQCLHRDSLKRVSGMTTTHNWRNDGTDHSVAKQPKLDAATVDAIDVTSMGHCLLSIDTQGQLSAFKMTPIMGGGGGVVGSGISGGDSNQMPIQYPTLQMVNLLEYCMLTGIDYLDIILAVKVRDYDGIVERISENFNRQLPMFQQYYYVHVLTLKANLFRFSLSGQAKAHDLTCLLMLHSILIAFKGLLRPSDLTSYDKGPAENLAIVLSESNTDVDKVLLNLEAKDFTVEPSTLQSLQQLIQWVADLTLNILARLPENVNNKAGYDISKDIVALNSIRELLVMIRIWGLLKEQCLPVFNRFSDNLDILSISYRLLTRLALNPNEPDDALLDDCCLLPNQVTIPNIHCISQRTSVSVPVPVTYPFYLEYNVEPEYLKFNPDWLSMGGGIGVSLSSSVANNNNVVVDSIRQLQLGKKPSQALLRKCSRCGSCSGFGSLAKTASMRAWEQRWASHCRCGGFWQLRIPQVAE